MAQSAHITASPGDESRRASDAIGLVLGGRYRLVSIVGSGASARVFAADDLQTRRRVAVKCLRPQMAQDPQLVERFYAEAQSAAKLDHPNLLKVTDWGQSGGLTYLVTDVLTGGSLHDVIHAGRRLEPSQALLVGLQVAQGLRAAHRENLVHRDIKPANLLFGDEGRLRVADFGMAGVLPKGDLTNASRQLLGTARYAAPEQSDPSQMTGRADLYSLVICLVEVVTGAVPLLGDNVMATLVMRTEHDIAASGALDALGPLGQALEPAGRADPNSRPDADAFISLLASAARSLPRPGRLPLVPLRERTETPSPVNNLSLSRPVLDPATTTSGQAKGQAVPTVPVYPQQAAGRESAECVAAPRPERDLDLSRPLEPQLESDPPTSMGVVVEQPMPDMAETVDGVIGPLTSPSYIDSQPWNQPGQIVDSPEPDIGPQHNWGQSEPDSSEVGVGDEPPLRVETGPYAKYPPAGDVAVGLDSGQQAPESAMAGPPTAAVPGPGGVWAMGRVGSPAERGQAPYRHPGPGSVPGDGPAPTNDDTASPNFASLQGAHREHDATHGFGHRYGQQPQAEAGSPLTHPASAEGDDSGSQDVWQSLGESGDGHAPQIADHYWGIDPVETGYVPHSLVLGISDRGHDDGGDSEDIERQGQGRLSLARGGLGDSVDSAWYLPAVVIAGLACMVALTIGLLVLATSKSGDGSGDASSDSMADYVGMGLDDVRLELEGAGWSLVVKQGRKDGTIPGEIIEQSPAAGSSRDPGGTIHLTISEGPEMREIPAINGKAVAEAKTLIEGAQLDVGAVTERHDEAIPAGRVVDVRIGGGAPESAVESGTKIDLVVSAGPTARIMPDLVGLEFDKIAEVTDPLGLVVSTRQDYSSSQPVGRVLKTEPEVNTTIQQGTEVMVTVSLGPKPQAQPAAAQDTTDSEAAG